MVSAAYVIDYRWPLWDVRLIQQYLSTPAIEKVGPKGIGRYLHRRAISGTVPDKVTWKPSKDMGYARVHQEMQESGIVEIAEMAHHDEAGLHPALEELLDLPKWRRPIDRPAKGDVPPPICLSSRQTTAAVRVRKPRRP